MLNLSRSLLRALAAGPVAAALALTVPGAAEPAPATAAQPPVSATATLPAGTPKPESGRPLLPKPAAASKGQTEYFAAMDEAIAPARDHALPTEDAGRIKEAVKAIGASNVAKAMDLKASISDPAARKLIDWYRLQRGFGTPEEYRAFLEANPAWPDRSMLRQRYEEALFTQGGSASAIKAAFKDAAPETGVGLAALASAYLAEGNEAEARKLAAKAWREHSIPATLETGFLDRFRGLLTAEDHKWRFDRLTLDDIRWTGERNAQAGFAKRTLVLLPETERKKAEARLRVFLKDKRGLQQVEALAQANAADRGLTYHRIQGLRRAGRVSEATALLLDVEAGEATNVSPDGWWEERRANAYLALKAGKPKTAYALVREAGALSVNPLKEQQFMAGWLALRHLKEPERAGPHFEAFKKAADGPLSRAKANYWLGRLEEARGNKSKADVHYREAASDIDTFHGLLAAQKIEPGRKAIEITAPSAPSADEIARFNSLDAVRAAVIARKAGLEPYILRLFIVQLRNVFDSESGAGLVAHLAEAVGDTQMALRTGKAAIAKRQNLFYYAYPVHPFPAYAPLRKPPETAFLLGVARQETEFNKLTVSGAGAKGLLQVMTVTAKHVCADYKIKCELDRLLNDTAYNTMLASAYIGDRLDDYRGSYVMALAGYNAGPGRVREWVREFGDPRTPSIDPIDWIERIPIQETREYVAKVLANVQMYRARLGEERAALQLEQDLVRARVADGQEEKPGIRAASAGNRDD